MPTQTGSCNSIFVTSLLKTGAPFITKILFEIQNADVAFHSNFTAASMFTARVPRTVSFPSCNETVEWLNKC